MPSNEDFAVRVLVGGVPLPEYRLDNQTYIECILSSPVSYKQLQAEYVSGELEKQEWPVTPYRIEITSHCRHQGVSKYFRILVDGVKVKAIALPPNESRVIKGFRDGSVIREFLFSMPRFAKDLTDRLGEGREQKIGVIEVECWDAECKTSQWRVRENQLQFVQANKKDCNSVTSGEYTMATSKAGKAIAQRSVLRKVDSWKRTRMRSSIKLLYRMGHTLQELGVTLQPLPTIDTAIGNNARGVTTDGIKTEIKTEPRETMGQQNNPIQIDDSDDNDNTPTAGHSQSQSNKKSRKRRRKNLVDLTEDSEESDSGKNTTSANTTRPRHNRLSRKKRKAAATVTNETANKTSTTDKHKDLQQASSIDGQNQRTPCINTDMEVSQSEVRVETETRVDPEISQSESRKEPETNQSATGKEPENSQSENEKQRENNQSESEIQPEINQSETGREPENDQSESEKEAENNQSESDKEPESNQSETARDPENNQSETARDPENNQSDGEKEPENNQSETGKDPEISQSESEKDIGARDIPVQMDVDTDIVAETQFEDVTMIEAKRLPDTTDNDRDSLKSDSNNADCQSLVESTEVPSKPIENTADDLTTEHVSPNHSPRIQTPSLPHSPSEPSSSSPHCTPSNQEEELLNATPTFVADTYADDEITSSGQQADSGVDFPYSRRQQRWRVVTYHIIQAD